MRGRLKESQLSRDRFFYPASVRDYDLLQGNFKYLKQRENRVCSTQKSPDRLECAGPGVSRISRKHFAMFHQD